MDSTEPSTTDDAASECMPGRMCPVPGCHLTTQQHKRHDVHIIDDKGKFTSPGNMTFYKLSRGKGAGKSKSLAREESSRVINGQTKMTFKTYLALQAMDEGKDMQPKTARSVEHAQENSGTSTMEMPAVTEAQNNNANNHFQQLQTLLHSLKAQSEAKIDKSNDDQVESDGPPCTHCGSANHKVKSCWKKHAGRTPPYFKRNDKHCSTSFGDGHKDTDCSPPHLKHSWLEKKAGRNNNCKYCGAKGHDEDRCWRLHPHLAEGWRSKICKHCGAKGHDEDKCWRLHPHLGEKWREQQRDTLTLVGPSRSKSYAETNRQ